MNHEQEKKKQSRHRALAMALALAGPWSPLRAQSAPAATEPTQLEAVTVTAERRAENIIEVPISISTLRGDQLDALNASGQDVRALSGRVPSLNIESSFGRAFPRFYIRGLGNTDFDLNASQPVSLVYDDVVQENPILKGFPVFDLDQIEVLRGPQGTLFGRNSPAGVVKFDSAKPVLGRSEGYVYGSLATYLTANAEGAISIPLGQAWAARVSMLYQHRDDWVDNTFAAGPNRKLEGYDEGAARVQLLYKPSGTFSALANLHARDLDGTARLFRANIIQAGTNDLVGGFDPAKVSIDGHNEQNLHNYGGSLRLRWDLGAVALNSITGYETLDTYSRGDIDGGFGAVFAPPSGPGLIPFPSESADGMPKHKQITQEVRAESTGTSALQWLTGVYLFHEDLTIDSFSYDTLAGGAQNGYAQQHQKNTAWAVFGSLKYAVTDTLKLRGGLRYTDDEKDFTAARFQSPVGAGAIGPLSTKPSDTDLSWDLSGTYALDTATNLYARVARGFRAPSIQGRLLFGDTISVAKSEKVLSFETGIKGDLLNRRARVGFNLFRYIVKDQQLTAVGGQANFNQLVNADKTIGQGAELDLQAIITERLLTTLGASYNKTKIKDPGLAIQPCGSGCTVLDPAGSQAGTVSIDGNSLPQAPQWVVNWTLQYSIPTASGEFFAYTDWAYRSKINFFLYESVEYTGKPLLEGGLRLGYQWSNYEVALFGRNITNQIRVVGGIDFNNLTGFINEPRIWGVQFKGRF